MTDHADLMQRADELRKQAERETDLEIRNRLVDMADHYTRLADSQSWSDAHPVSIASAADVLTKRA